MTAPLVSVEGLRVLFKSADRTVHAVNGVDFALQPGEVLGLLGESGSGKSVTLKALLRLLPASRTTLSGKVTVAGHDVLAMDEKALRRYRGGVVSMLAKNRSSSDSPYLTSRRSNRSVAVTS